MNGTITTKPFERQTKTLSNFGLSPMEIERLDKKQATEKIRSHTGIDQKKGEYCRAWRDPQPKAARRDRNKNCKKAS
jgi:hypothetical protein